jgi:hypothetical protein
MEPPLQIADRPDTDAGSVGKFYLRQSGVDAQPAEQRAKRRLLG